MLPQQVLAQPFKLPNGSVIRNRLAKAAMADRYSEPMRVKLLMQYPLERTRLVGNGDD